MITKISSILILIFGFTCVACNTDEARIQSGSYAVHTVAFDIGETERQELLQLEITVDRVGHSATIVTDNGSEITFVLDFTPRAAWLSDCHTNTSHTKVEVATSDATTIDLGPVSFVRPTLVANCDSGGLSLVEGCPAADECLRDGRTILFRTVTQ